MPRNVEIKARIPVEVFEQFRDRVAEISTSGPLKLSQTDTFFHCNHGRLKLRQFEDSTAELIFYRRPDQAGPKISQFIISKCDPDTMLAILAAAHGIVGVVEKRREVFFINQTRVHLDEVENLGTFLELEVVLEEEQSEELGEKIANQILADLNVPQSSLVSNAYIDLLQSRQDRL